MPVSDLRPAHVLPPELISSADSNRSPAHAERLSELDDLVRGFLLSKRAPKTRDAYAADIASWLSWCQALGVDPLTAGIHHADAYLRLLAERGDPRTGRPLAPSSIARCTSALVLRCCSS